MSLYSFIASFGSAGVAPALPLLQYQILPPLPLTKLTHLVAVNVLLLGCSNIWWVPLGNTFGRRPILIVAMLIGTFASMWCGLSTSFNSLLAARCIQGIGFGPADTISPDTVGELFFLHERGRAMVS
jgi:MFS family permease